MVAALAVGGRRALKVRAEARVRAAADQQMIDTLVDTRSEIPADTRSTARARGNKTFALGRTEEREFTPVRESVPRGGSHAEELTLDDMSGKGNNQTVAVDQVPCEDCDVMLEQRLSPGSRAIVPREVGGDAPRRSIDPKYSGGIKATSEAAARGEIEVESYTIIKTPKALMDTVDFAPVSYDYRDEHTQISIDPTQPTQAELEAQQSLPEPQRYR